MVIHGYGGLDELSTEGPNRVSALLDGEVTTFELDPTDLGLARGKLDDFIGGTPEENAVITRDILSGKDQGPRRDLVLLNAAATLSVECHDFAAGLDEARQSIDSGKALATMERWIEKTNSFQ
jgi:anthranilate phosphoribosyltransferase